ncbi:hypothetical protein Tco_1505212 [Tanacetum coccineum]
MSETEGMVTKLMNQLAAQGEQLQSMSTELTPSDVSPVDINPIDNSADEEGGTLLSGVGCENDASIQKSNGLATSEKEMEKGIRLGKATPPNRFLQLRFGDRPFTLKRTYMSEPLGNAIEKDTINGLLVVSGSGPAVTSNWAVCCALNPTVFPPIPPEGVKVMGGT